MEKKYGPRKDLGKSADGWFKKLGSPQREIALALRKLVLAADPGLVEALKWGMPNYDKNGHVAGIMAAKAHVSLFFQNGAKLKDPKGRLEGGGKTIRALKITDVKQIPSADVKRWIKDVVAMSRKR